MLQDQYNKEYDQILTRTEEKFNRDAKGNINLLLNYIINKLFLFFAVNTIYANHRIRSFNDYDDKDTDIEDTTRDFDRFVVSMLHIHSPG